MDAWEHYYELTGTSAVTLVGLLFVVITLGAERAERGDEGLLSTFLTPTFVHLAVVFLIALLYLSPVSGRLILPFGLIGVLGLILSAAIALKIARNDRWFSDAWFFHGGIPVVCYAGIIWAAWLSTTSMQQTLLVLGAVSALLLLVGMRNGWAAAVDMARRKPK